MSSISSEREQPKPEDKKPEDAAVKPTMLGNFKKWLRRPYNHQTRIKYYAVFQKLSMLFLTLLLLNCLMLIFLNARSRLLVFARNLKLTATNATKFGGMYKR